MNYSKGTVDALIRKGFYFIILFLRKKNKKTVRGVGLSYYTTALDSSGRK